MRKYVGEEECEDDAMDEVETIREPCSEEEKRIIEQLPCILRKWKKSRCNRDEYLYPWEIVWTFYHGIHEVISIVSDTPEESDTDDARRDESDIEPSISGDSYFSHVVHDTSRNNTEYEVEEKYKWIV